jgi:polar amino acid transport system permease protein
MALLLGLTLAATATGQDTGLHVVVMTDMRQPIEKASVYVDGTFAGCTDDLGSFIVDAPPAGKHNITAVYQGFENKTIEWDSTQGMLLEFLLNLKVDTTIPPDAVYIVTLDDRVAQSKVAGAYIYVDGKFAGRTNTGEGKLVLSLKGEHTITAVKDGYDNSTVMIIAEPGETYTVYMKLSGEKLNLFDREIFVDALGKEIMYGAVNTVKLSIIAMAFGLVIGLIMGMGRVSSNRIFRGFASVYVEGIRGLPILLQLLIAAYGIPFLVSELFGIQFTYSILYNNLLDFLTNILTIYPPLRDIIVPSIQSIIGDASLFPCVIALSMNSGAYIGEIFKGGIEAVHKGQMEAARSLGMSYGQSMRFVILPQAFKIVLPTLGNEFIALVKDSSIGLVISYSEIVWWSRQVGAMYYNAFTPLLAAGMVYLFLTIPLGRAVQYLEKRYNIQNSREGGAGLFKKKPRPKLPEETA